MIKNPDKFFYACNGVVLKSFTDFTRFLESCDDGTFYYHVTNDRNDFANWVGSVCRKKDLAKKMSHEKNKDSMVALLKQKKK